MIRFFRVCVNFFAAFCGDVVALLRAVGPLVRPIGVSMAIVATTDFGWRNPLAGVPAAHFMAVKKIKTLQRDIGGPRPKLEFCPHPLIVSDRQNKLPSSDVRSANSTSRQARGNHPPQAGWPPPHGPAWRELCTRAQAHAPPRFGRIGPARRKPCHFCRCGDTVVIRQRSSKSDPALFSDN
jgi:hypothetical protein